MSKLTVFMAFVFVFIAPPKPEGLMARTLLLANPSDMPALELEWLPEPFGNGTNYIDEYIIELWALSPAPQAKRGGFAWTIRVPGVHSF